MTDHDTTLIQLRRQMGDFVAARDWRQFHDPKNLAMSIAIESAELMEHFQWLRSDQLAELRNDAAQMNDIREEVADILAYLVSFANAMDIDLSAAFDAKMAKNAGKYPADRFKGRFKAGAADD